MAKQKFGNVEQIFLCNGDAIALPTLDMLKILHKIKRCFLNIKEIATYAGSKSTLSKSKEELRLLWEADLTKAYPEGESALVNKNWTQILNFFTTKIDFLCSTMDFLIHPCLAGWSVSGILRL